MLDTTKVLSFGLGFILMLNGCASMQYSLDLSENKTFESIISDEICTAKVGDVILKKGRVTVLPAIDLKDEVKSTPAILQVTIIIPPQKLIASYENENWIHFKGKNIMISDFSFLRPVEGGLRISKNENEEKAKESNRSLRSSRIKKGIQIFADTSLYSHLPAKEPIYEMVEEKVYKSNDFEKYLVFDSFDKDNISFIYKEVPEGEPKLPFSEKLHVNLSSTNILSIKGAKIEIIENNANGLKFRLLKGFDD